MMIKNNQYRTALSFVFIILVCSLMAFSPANALASSYSKIEVAERFKQIALTYSVGEILSEEDRTFVETYGSQPSLSPDASLYATGGSSDANASRTMYGVTATLLGEVWHSGTGAYEWGATLTGRATSGPTPSKLEVSAKVQAFGLTSSGGMILLYTNTLSNTSYNSRVVQMSRSDSYAGLVVFYYVTSQLDVTTSSGATFTVQSSW